jgi:hypothetical protein
MFLKAIPTAPIFLEPYRSDRVRCTALRSLGLSTFIQGLEISAALQRDDNIERWYLLCDPR